MWPPMFGVVRTPKLVVWWVCFQCAFFFTACQGPALAVGPWKCVTPLLLVAGCWLLVCSFVLQFQLPCVLFFSSKKRPRCIFCFGFAVPCTRHPTPDTPTPPPPPPRPPSQYPANSKPQHEVGTICSSCFVTFFVCAFLDVPQQRFWSFLSKKRSKPT
jgi:hypothetical protein